MLPNGPRSIPEWIEVIDSTDGADDRIRRFAEWIAAAPPLEPVSVASLLGEVVEGYAERGLPETKVADSPALLDTETDARAIVRVRTLVRQLRHKFADRLEEDAIERSWADVADLAGVIATQRPGRREHSNARALDVFEANDIWALDVPYVIGVGMTAEEWPQPSRSPLPPEFQEAILRGRERRGRSRRSRRGSAAATAISSGTCSGRRGGASSSPDIPERPGDDDVARSPLLDHLDTRRVSEDARRRLIGTGGSFRRNCGRSSVTDRSEAMESRRETVSDDGGDGDGDADPIRLRGAQREIRDAYFASDSGLFTLDCVPGPANRSSPTTSPPRTSSADTRPGTRHLNSTSRSSRLTATRRPTSSRRSAIGCRRSSNTTSSPPRPTSLGQSYDTSDSACDRPLTRAPSMDSCARYSGNSRAISVSTRCRRSGTTRS